MQEADWDAGDWQQRGVRYLPALLLSITASYRVTGTCQLPDLSSPGSSCLSALSTPGIPAGKEHSTSLLAAVSSPCVPAGAGDVGRLCRAGRALPCLTRHPQPERKELPHVGRRKGAEGENHLEQSSWVCSRAKRP